VSAFKI
jgi:tryptophanyl-tRNA synthetase